MAAEIVLARRRRRRGRAALGSSPAPVSMMAARPAVGPLITRGEEAVRRTLAVDAVEETRFWVYLSIDKDDGPDIASHVQTELGAEERKGEYK